MSVETKFDPTIPSKAGQWSDCLKQSARMLVQSALREDLGLEPDDQISTKPDLTSFSLIGADQSGRVDVVVRQAGVVAGLPVGEMVFRELDDEVFWLDEVEDGQLVEAGTVVARVTGPLRSLLVGERTCLNFLSHLSGIASNARRYVQAANNDRVDVLDTRKTLPGYRLLQKYAVACGGAVNHRMGLYDGVLIKDNHLAAWQSHSGESSITDAIRKARQSAPAGTTIEVEVDTLDQLVQALDAPADIVLLDNMSVAELESAVKLRDDRAASVKLEASGNITLDTIADIAMTGVDRISCGALTHSVTALDIGFDWHGHD